MRSDLDPSLVSSTRDASGRRGHSLRYVTFSLRSTSVEFTEGPLARSACAFLDILLLMAVKDECHTAKV